MTNDAFLTDIASVDPKRGMARLLSLSALTLALTACATNGAGAGPLDPARESQIHHACADTMGLNPTELQFIDCTISLRQTLSRMDDAKAAAEGQQSCAQRGLKFGTPDFALCVVNAEDSLAKSGAGASK